MKMNKFVVLSVVAAFSLALTACGDDSSDETNSGPSNSIEATLGQSVLNNYADIVYASYSDSLTAAEAMDVAIDALIADPTPDTMNAAREAWLASREPYLQTEVYRFYEGPIDMEPGGPEGLLNAWPMDEAWVDYVRGDGGESQGIINKPDLYPEITADLLESLNEAEKDDNIATGYHAIEFLLWGQDDEDPFVSGAGKRPFTDYIADGSGTASNQTRRAQYLKVVSTMLIGHLTGLKAAWAPNANNYRASFVAQTPTAGVAKIMTGMIVLAGFETGGERVQAALASGGQEDEHSCFSDNTHRDMIQDVQGIQNVFLGTYGAVSGPGIKDLVAANDPALAARIETAIADALSAANRLPIPFDQAIASSNAEGRAIVENLVTQLRVANDALRDAFVFYGFEIPEDTLAFDEGA